MSENKTIFGKNVENPESATEKVGVIELGKRLMIASQAGDTNLVKDLMRNGAPFATDWLGTSSLHIAANGGHLETCRLLLKSGILKDTKNKVDKTPLHFAAAGGHSDVVYLLVQKGADVHALDMLLMTPLHWAVENEHIETIEILLQNGALPNIMNKFERTCYDIAEDLHRPDILELLNNGCKEGEYTVIPTSMQTQQQCVAAQPKLPVISTVVKTCIPSTSKTVTYTVRSKTNRPTTNIIPQAVLPKSTKIVQQEAAQPQVKVRFIETPRVERIKMKEEKDRQATLQLLEEHGIEMLDDEDVDLVASAVGSGQTVVLTEAGKQALSLTKGDLPTFIKRASTSTIQCNRPKIIRLAPQQVTTSFKKRVERVTSSSVVPEQIHTNKTTVLGKGNTISDISEALAAARREAQQYKVLYAKKQKEAQVYKSKLQTITMSSNFDSEDDDE